MTRRTTARRSTSPGRLALLAILLATGLPAPAQSDASADRVALAGYAIDKTEVTIGRFRIFVAATGLVTQAERAGHGFEYGAGWERRPGWSWRQPFGAAATAEAQANAPAVHLSWSEARDFCAWAGGRLPTRAEWQGAAYREQRPAPGERFVTGRTYPYPVGDTPEGMNLSGSDPWPRHAPAGATQAGVNGLYEMGGNAWEWLADRDGDAALTAGGSWWYGAQQTRAEGMQWKPAAFFAVYVGFRCVYGAP